MTNLELVLTKELYHCYYFWSMKKNIWVMCSVIPFKAVTAIWQLEVITDTAICRVSNQIREMLLFAVSVDFHTE